VPPSSRRASVSPHRRASLDLGEHASQRASAIIDGTRERGGHEPVYMLPLLRGVDADRGIGDPPSVGDGATRAFAALSNFDAQPVVTSNQEAIRPT
jgi:hypothetical protein